MLTDPKHPTPDDLRAAAVNMHSARFDYHDPIPPVEEMDQCELRRLEGLAEIAIYAYLDRHYPTPPSPPLPSRVEF